MITGKVMIHVLHVLLMGHYMQKQDGLAYKLESNCTNSNSVK